MQQLQERLEQQQFGDMAMMLPDRILRTHGSEVKRLMLDIHYSNRLYPYGTGLRPQML